jgi:hypothetical protein
MRRKESACLYFVTGRSSFSSVNINVFLVGVWSRPLLRKPFLFMSDYDSTNPEPAVPEDEAVDTEELEPEDLEAAEADESEEAEDEEQGKKAGKVEKVECVDCKKKWKLIDEANRYYRTHEGAHCRVKYACRARKIGAEYKRLKLNKWGRRTQGQLLIIMDCPPKDWPKDRKWKSITKDVDERVAAAIEYFSTCSPVSLLYAVQTDPDGEPIWDPYLGTWKHHTARTLAAVLGVHQTTVNRAILSLKVRHRVEVIDGRIVPILAPKPLGVSEREACTQEIASGSGTSFTAVLPRARTVLFERLTTYPPEACTQLRRIAIEACIVQNRGIADVRTRCADTILEACNCDISLLSRVLEGQSDPPSTSSSSSESGRVPADLPGKENDDDEKQERNEALYAYQVPGPSPETERQRPTRKNLPRW